MPDSDIAQTTQSVAILEYSRRLAACHRRPPFWDPAFRCSSGRVKAMPPKMVSENYPNRDLANVHVKSLRTAGIGDALRRLGAVLGCLGAVLNAFSAVLGPS